MPMSQPRWTEMVRERVRKRKCLRSTCPPKAIILSYRHCIFNQLVLMCKSILDVAAMPRLSMPATDLWGMGDAGPYEWELEGGKC